MSRTFDVAYLAKAVDNSYLFKIKGEQEWTFFSSSLLECLEWYGLDADYHGAEFAEFTMCIPGEFL